MSSIVTEILSSAGKLEKEELGTKISALTRLIDDTKIQLQESLQTRYIKFLPSSIRTTELENKINIYTNEIHSLTNMIQNELIGQIQESSEEFQTINKQLAVANAALNVIKDLIEAHERLEECDLKFQEQNFVEAVNCLLQVDQLLSQLQSTWEGQIKVLNGLKMEYLVHSEKLKYDMGEIWNEYLLWSIEEAPKLGDRKDCLVHLAIKKSEDLRTLPLESLVRAMHSMHYLDIVLKLFCSRLQKHIFHPIITEITRINVAPNVEISSLHLTRNSTLKAKPTPGDVFGKLTIALEFLNDIFGKITFDNKQKQTLMQRIGTMVYQDFRDTLVKECLSQSIPAHRKDLGAYDKVVEATTNFHGILSAMGFMHPDDDSILKYAQNVDSLFTTKMCQGLMCKARKIMLEDLYDAVPTLQTDPVINKATGVKYIKSELGSYIDSDSHGLQSEPYDLPDKEGSSSNLLQFPQCHISKSAQKLVEMLNHIMHEAVSSLPSCAAHLFLTARNIIDLYCDIVPCYHKDSLESLPQQSALLHSNCMYIAHHLMTIGHKFRIDLPKPLDEHLITFIDLVPKVRSLGVEVFLAQLRLQRKQLLSNMAEAGDFRNMIGEDKFVPAVEKALKQCLLQLEHLAKVWQDVLPQNVCKKALGTLLNTLIEEIITRVTSLEDLPANNAAHLISIFGILKDKAPSYFKTGAEESSVADLVRYIPKWIKFQELLLILEANMQEILDRWSSGKGPLAQEFTVDEVKQLIRALFQNTDRRAAVLAKIK